MDQLTSENREARFGRHRSLPGAENSGRELERESMATYPAMRGAVRNILAVGGQKRAVGRRRIRDGTMVRFGRVEVT